MVRLGAPAGPMITEHQYQRLMKEYAKSGVLRTAAMKAGMHRETAAKYHAAGHGPVPEKKRGRRRPDPLTSIWPAAERFLLGVEGLDVRIVRLPFVYGDGDPHIEEAAAFLQRFSPTQRQSIAHHADVGRSIALLLDARAPAHRIYNLTDDDAPTLTALLAVVGAPPPDGTSRSTSARQI